jgi:hypothetical protein
VCQPTCSFSKLVGHRSQPLSCLSCRGCPATERCCLLDQVLAERRRPHARTRRPTAGPPRHAAHPPRTPSTARSSPSAAASIGPDSARTLAGSRRGRGSCSSPHTRSPTDRDLHIQALNSPHINAIKGKIFYEDFVLWPHKLRVGTKALIHNRKLNQSNAKLLSHKNIYRYLRYIS